MTTPIELFRAACMERFAAEKIELTATRTLSGVEGFKRDVPFILYPESTEEVRDAIELANRFIVAITPVSTGKNWGFGSRLPVRQESVVMNLSRMNRIREINTDFGFAVIEPGVTQKQLADALAHLHCDYYLDVTGAGADTSVIGNALEKGIAYNSLRAECLSDLEVVLGNGRIMRTGFGHIEGSSVAPLFKHGIGPSLDGLFLQSNFGIVTAATIHLMPKTEMHRSLSMLIKPENLSIVIDRLRGLMRDGLIQGIPHIGNNERIRTTFAPLLEREYERHGEIVSRAEIEKKLEKLLPVGWSLVASLRGKARVVCAAEKEIRRELSGLGRLLFLGPELGSVPRLLVPLVFGRDAGAVLSATDGIRALTHGKPSNDGIEAVQWDLQTKCEIKEGHDDFIERGSRGFLFCTPLAPLSGASAVKMESLANEVARRFGFTAGITLNPISERVLEAVISISFDRTSLGETERAHACLKKMNQIFIETGFTPYRVNIDFMQELVRSNSPYWQQVAELKEVLDPMRVIAPGRYNLV